MLSDQDKRDMLADGLSRERRQAFLKAERRKSTASGSLDEYIAFLMDVQKIMPFEHKRAVTPTAKNIL